VICYDEGQICVTTSSLVLYGTEINSFILRMKHVDRHIVSLLYAIYFFALHKEHKGVSKARVINLELL
jgi:hypothetical protein